MTTMDDTIKTLFGSSSRALNERAFAVLETVLKNIIDRPKNPTFRTLKFSNRRLSEDLFTHDGATELLKSLGFEEKLQEGEDTMVLSHDVDSDRRWRMQDALDAIAKFRDEERAAAEASRALMEQRRSVMFAIRRERWERAATAGADEGVAFVRELMSHDKFGEGFDALLERCGLALKIVGNIIDNPTVERFRTLKFTNATVANALLKRDGVLELLLVVGGFREDDEGVHFPSGLPTTSLETARSLVIAVQEELKRRKAEADAETLERARASIIAQRNRERVTAQPALDESVVPGGP